MGSLAERLRSRGRHRLLLLHRVKIVIAFHKKNRRVHPQKITSKTHFFRIAAANATRDQKLVALGRWEQVMEEEGRPSTVVYGEGAPPRHRVTAPRHQSEIAIVEKSCHGTVEKKRCREDKQKKSTDGTSCVSEAPRRQGKGRRRLPTQRPTSQTHGVRQKGST